MIEVLRADSEKELARCMAIRLAVFVEEQGVPAALEQDEHDGPAGMRAGTAHFLAVSGGEALGTGRFRPKGPYLKLERIATVAAARGRGVGAALMRRMHEAARSEHPTLLPMMHAQMSAVSFYERLGWVAFGPRFSEAGIEHLAMALVPEAKALTPELKALMDSLGIDAKQR